MKSKLSKKKVLVVEDETPLLEIITRKMELCGFEILIAQNVPDAILVLNKHKIVDAIWLDHYLLGKKSGLDLVVELRGGREEWKKIPVFVVSNTASPEKFQAYTELGIVKYYIKASSSLNQISEEIQSFLGDR